jgi:beta-galactosidase
MFRRYLGDEVVLFTTDPAFGRYVKCGKIPGVYATIDSGGAKNPEGLFRVQRTVEPAGPYVNSEFYPGWMSHWNSSHHPFPTSFVTRQLDEMLALNASVSMYMYHGGTSFNFYSGANSDNTTGYIPEITSYDFDAPLSEAGDPTEKYYAIRDIIAKYIDVPNGTLPQPSPKLAFGPVTLMSVGTIFELLPVLTAGEPVVAETPLTFEALSQPHGYVLYEKVLMEDYSADILSVPEIHDRAYVFINDSVVGILERMTQVTDVSITASEGETLRILVENQGRINFGAGIQELKGLLPSVTLGGSELVGEWTHYSLPFNNTDLLLDLSTSSACSLPAAFAGSFVLPNSTVLDTYLDPTGWGKGVAIVNGVNLGRYWPTAGPQVTLYVPSVYLNPYPATNSIVMVEFEQSNCEVGQSASVTFTDVPNIDAHVSSNL